MARARVVHPNFFLNEQLVAAEQATGLPLRLAYVGLWTQADRMGRFEWRPTVLKLAILPWDACDFAAVLEALEAAGFITSWAVEDRRYGHIPTWARWQRPHPREAPSRIPPPPPHRASPGPTSGTPKASPRNAGGLNSLPHNDNAGSGSPKARPGLTQGAPEDGLGHEKSAGLKTLRSPRTQDSKVSSDLGSSEDSNGLSSLREDAPMGASDRAHPDLPAGVEPPPEPTPEDLAATERRKADFLAKLEARRREREAET